MADKADAEQDKQYNPEKLEDVKTGADRLLELVNSSKEVAMAEAARQLGVPLQTVEAWANFLEEDGLITVKYKFTTPYLTVPQAPKAKAKAEPAGSTIETALDLTGVQKELGSIKESLAKAAEEKSAGEFGLLRQTYVDALSRMRLAYEKLFAEAEIAPQKRVALQEAQKELEQTLRAATDYAAKGRFDQANAYYARLHAQATSILEKVSQVHEQIATFQSIRETKDYRDLLGQAYQLMTEGKVEEAKRLYEKLSFAHENLAKEFVEKKHKMEEDIVKLNKDLSKRVDQLNVEKLKKLTGRITALLNAGKGFLNKGGFDTAETYYLTIKHEYTELPPGFAEEKKEIQQKVLDFYSALSRQREKSIGQTFERSARQIEALIKEVRGLVNEGKVEAAMQLYRQIRLLFTKLPRGFLSEKAALQEKILPLHNTITSTYTQMAVAKLKSKASEIIAFLGTMRQHTEKGELRRTEEAYERIKQLYKDLPKGFLHEETELQNQIVQAYESYLKKAKEMESSSFASTLSAIAKLLGEAEAELKRNDYEAANRTYLKLMELYNGLPAGFMAKKVELRERILHLYKTILSLTDTGTLVQGRLKSRQQKPKPQQQSLQSPAAAVAAVDGMIRVITDIHNMVSKGNFQFLREGMAGLDKLAEKVPSLAKTNPKLFSKIADMKMELELYKNASALKQLFESSRFQKLKSALDLVRSQCAALRQRCPEDKALFDYATGQHGIYLSRLMSSTAIRAVPALINPRLKAAGHATLSTLGDTDAGNNKYNKPKEAAGSADGYVSGEAEEAESVEKKIEKLKSMNKATVRLPL